MWKLEKNEWESLKKEMKGKSHPHSQVLLKNEGEKKVKVESLG